MRSPAGDVSLLFCFSSFCVVFFSFPVRLVLFFLFLSVFRFVCLLFVSGFVCVFVLRFYLFASVYSCVSLFSSSFNTTTNCNFEVEVENGGRRVSMFYVSESFQRQLQRQLQFDLGREVDVFSVFKPFSSKLVGLVLSRQGLFGAPILGFRGS